MHKGECILPRSNKKKVGLIVGITVGGVLIIALACTVGIIVGRKNFRRKEGVAIENRREVKDMPTAGSGDEKESKHLVDQDYSMITVPNPTKSCAFSLSEMISATENFSQKIGQGGFGSVFFGQLPEGKDIAVKVLSLFSNHGVHQFLNEVNLLSRVNHRNLVSLLGYCNESRELMLIYDHMSGGSLKDRLYGLNAQSSELNWKTRLKIALDAGQGLEYLHMGCTPKIIHRDVKTANILLDSNLNGILGDFGLSRMTMDGEASHITTAVKGTAGYLDPAYFRTHMLTDKSDVYSFGVVLLEIISGRPAIDTKLDGEERNLVRWVRSYLVNEENPDKITEIIDKRLHVNSEMKSITSVANLAIRWVQRDPYFRPSVSEVVTELKENIEEIE
jgi:serine/threonine protein kinase